MLEKLWIFFLVSLGVVSVVAWIVALMHEKGIRPVRKVWEVFKAQSVVGRAFLASRLEVVTVAGRRSRTSGSFWPP